MDNINNSYSYLSDLIGCNDISNFWLDFLRTTEESILYMRFMKNFLINLKIHHFIYLFSLMFFIFATSIKQINSNFNKLLLNRQKLLKTLNSKIN